MSTPVRLYMVGGAVRDHLDAVLHTSPHDFDFAVEALNYAHMRAWLLSHGASIWQERPEYATIRCCIPYASLGGDFDHFDAFKTYKPESKVPCDFVLCRRDGFYSDSRRPDAVYPGELTDDLARRDFTVNAMALSPDGEVHDPHMGQYDLRYRILRAVGSAPERLQEDPLRILRALRFAVTRSMGVDYTLAAALKNHAKLLHLLPEERVAEELTRMFKHSTPDTLALLSVHREVLTELFTAGSRLWLLPTLKDRA